MPLQDSEFWVSVKTPVLRIVASVSANHQSIKEDAVVGMLLSLCQEKENCLYSVRSHTTVNTEFP